MNSDAKTVLAVVALSALVLGGTQLLGDSGESKAPDAGIPECVRRPRGVAADACMRTAKMMDGERLIDPGELNRFSAVDAVGTGCEPVDCSVVVGEDSEK